MYFLLGNPPTERGCEGPGVGEGGGNMEGRLGEMWGGHAGVGGIGQENGGEEG